MQLLIGFMALLELSSKLFMLVEGSFFWDIQKDLRDLNATCPTYSSCNEPRKGDNMPEYSCNCASFCRQLDTCCANSNYVRARPPKIRPSCRSVYSRGSYFVVDRCSSSDDKKSMWEQLCHEEWNGEDDVMKIVPVTSLFTQITYKNYFCFRCHENTDDYLYWNLNLHSNDQEFDQSIDDTKVSFTYDSQHQQWHASVGVDGAFVPVYFGLDIPHEIFSLVLRCQKDIISNCSEMWSDEDVRDKCKAYMGIVYVETNTTVLKYRNAHCALCNYEDPNDILCESTGFGIFGGGHGGFSFTHLLDINQSDGDEVGKVKKCASDSMWDPYAKKCRKLTCALPGYVVRNGQCTRP